MLKQPRQNILQRLQNKYFQEYYFRNQVILIKSIKVNSIGFKHHWELVSERTGEATRLYSIEASKVNLVSAIDIYEDEEIELLLCHNMCVCVSVLGMGKDWTLKMEFTKNVEIM
ncbi:hypothetical protein Anas_09173 [Armadillidium nasatum]|uniref:Uncharacterized protein n=1 Tax=Armadillidium nasatum TaxID=96803 RepID=A0A5N5SJH2_9CRUS|nr:hypothetical protein Anas_09173 [Armadillidium nasatum]